MPLVHATNVGGCVLPRLKGGTRIEQQDVPESHPLVSILTTSYNHSRWLPDTLESVEAQTYDRLEHIVVDDGSVDDSIDILERASSRLPDLRWFSQTNQGQAIALNRAFEESRGDILGWISSDDVYFSARSVERAVDALISRPDAVAAYGHSVLIDATGGLIKTHWAPPPNAIGWRMLRFMCSQPTLFVRRSALKGYFVDPAFDIAMDTELIFRLHRSGAFVRVPHIQAGERHHPARKSYAADPLDGSREREGERLEALGVHQHGARHFGSRVIYRYWGLTLVPEASREALAFSGHRDGIARLAFRQVFVRRGWVK